MTKVRDTIDESVVERVGNEKAVPLLPDGEDGGNGPTFCFPSASSSTSFPLLL
jgi:hypothetical protein